MPPLAIHYEHMFDGLPKYQLDQLTKVWDATAKAMHWCEYARHEMGRALAAGCTPEHLAAVTGFDAETVKRLLHRPRHEFAGRHPTDPTRPARNASTGDSHQPVFEMPSGASSTRTGTMRHPAVPPVRQRAVADLDPRRHPAAGWLTGVRFTGLDTAAMAAGHLAGGHEGRT
jgi:hypothetical protein